MRGLSPRTKWGQEAILGRTRWAHLLHRGHHPGHQHDACSLRGIVNTPEEKEKVCLRIFSLRMQKNVTLFIMSLVGMKISTATTENRINVPEEIKNWSTI